MTTQLFKSGIVALLKLQQKSKDFTLDMCLPKRIIDHLFPPPLALASTISHQLQEHEIQISFEINTTHYFQMSFQAYSVLPCVKTQVDPYFFIALYNTIP